MATNCATLNINFNDTMLNTSANLLIVGYFIYMTGKYIVDKFDINVIDVIHKITHKIVNEDETPLPIQSLPIPTKIKKQF